jgi:hypothetical protein
LIALLAAAMSRILSVIVLLTLGTAVASADDAPLPPTDFAAKFAAPDLEFDGRPAWTQNLEYISKNGLPFIRLKRNAHSDLVLGIRGDGCLSIFLIARRDRRTRGR